ncbi:hypothetical protein EV368DRAFT_88983 [Lentinula lateritia]|nr:hypothetical protein EV368DRAFT_88983 [Lentinula lateritia]
MTSRTTTSTINQPSASTSSRPTDPPSPGATIDNEEDVIMREALAKVERVKARKAAEAAKKKAAEEAAAMKAAEEAERKKNAAARRQAAQDARDRAIRAQEQEDKVIERRLQQPEVKGEPPLSKRKGKARAQPIGEDPDDGDNDDDDEDREPCERCVTKRQRRSD